MKDKKRNKNKFKSAFVKKADAGIRIALDHLKGSSAPSGEYTQADSYLLNEPHMAKDQVRGDAFNLAKAQSKKLASPGEIFDFDKKKKSRFSIGVKLTGVVGLMILLAAATLILKLKNEHITETEMTFAPPKNLEAPVANLPRVEQAPIEHPPAPAVKVLAQNISKGASIPNAQVHASPKRASKLAETGKKSPARLAHKSKAKRAKRISKKLTKKPKTVAAN